MVHAHAHSNAEQKKFVNPIGTIPSLGIEHGMKIADFGAGSGAYTLAAAEYLSGSGTVFAIDIQKDLLRRIKNEAHKRRLHNVEIIWNDLETPESSKLSPRSVDLVLLSNVLFQLPDKKAPLIEAARIVKKNGRVIIIDWTDSFGGMGPHKDDVVPKAAAKALAHGASLHVIEEFNPGAHHYGLVCSPRASAKRV